MMIILKPGARQIIGRAGERANVSVGADIKAWLTSYATGTGSFMVTAPDGTRTPLTGVKDTDHKLLTADVPEELMAAPGLYVYQAVWVQAGVQVASERFDCILLGTELAKSWTPHKAAPDWAERIFIAAETIENAMDAALQAEVVAMDSADKAEAAQGKAEDAQEAAETAQGKAEDAQEAAEAAAESVTAASESEAILYLGIATEPEV